MNIIEEKSSDENQDRRVGERRQHGDRRELVRFFVQHASDRRTGNDRRSGFCNWSNVYAR